MQCCTCCIATQAVLDKDVRLYHDLVINLKARLEQEACDAEEDATKEQELAELEESLASSCGGGGGGGKGDNTVSGLDTMSLNSDTPPSAQVIWAGGACGALAYESVDELRVAVESLQRLHAELQEETKSLTVRVEESRAEDAARRSGGGDGDPIASCLLEAAEAWVATSKTTRPGDGDPEEVDGGGRVDGSGVLLLSASVGGQCSSRRSRYGDGNKHDHDIDNGRRGSLRSRGKKNGLRTPGSSSGRGARSQRGRPLQQDQDNLLSSSPSAVGHRGGGALAAAAKTPLRRRELFYHLVEAFRDYQSRERRQHTTKAVDDDADADGEGPVGGEGLGGGSVPRMGLSTAAAAAAGAEGGGGTGGSTGDQLPPINVSCGGGDGDPSPGFGEVSSSASISMSVRTLCDFGPPEYRSVSTQTMAKVGGHCPAIAGD